MAMKKYSDHLSSVRISNPQDGDILVFNAATQTWQNMGNLSVLIAMLSNLQTTDPHIVGYPWNDGGVVVLSSG